ncbi:hypothetical protein DERP_004295 [Dermatophagoides pteronyssinus]|uniref:Uncharacterized protein n=1 Tax=Dermatophagoides pteronyssinus TaxID=6956 RepID=A0ABQ8JNW9_DERPT|nr:hypothetical protein DERP_004295 [Dermatophagoides pteronyssinus]
MDQLFDGHRHDKYHHLYDQDYTIQCNIEFFPGHHNLFVIIDDDNHHCGHGRNYIGLSIYTDHSPINCFKISSRKKK